MQRGLRRAETATRPAPAPEGSSQPRRPQSSSPVPLIPRDVAAATQPSDPRYQFLARFGAVVLSGGIAAIPMALYHYQAELGLTPQEVWFVGYILAHRWTAALPYPSLRRM